MAITKIKNQFDHACQAVSATSGALAVSGKNALRRKMEAADTVEYVLMAAIFCLGICLAAFMLRGQISTIFNNINNTLKNANTQGGGF